MTDPSKKFTETPADYVIRRFPLFIAGFSLFLHVALVSAHYYMEKERMTADATVRALYLKPALLHDSGLAAGKEREISPACMDAVYAALYGADGNQLSSIGGLESAPGFAGEMARKAAGGDTVTAMADGTVFRDWSGKTVTGSLQFVFMPLDPPQKGVLAAAFDFTFQRNNFKRSILSFFVFSGSAIWITAALAFLLVKKVKDTEEKAKAAALETTAIKNRILSTVSHELRTPLNGIVGMITVLKDTGLTVKQQKYAEIAEKCASDLTELVNKIIEYVRFETGMAVLNEREFCPEHSVSMLIECFMPEAAKRGLGLEFTIDGGVPGLVWGDEEKLGRILHTFLDNALRFTKKGKVSVHVEPAGQKGQAALYRFSVKDTGMGIGPDQMKAIFTPLTQVDQSLTRRENGLGLGLSLAEGLAGAMGGNIYVKSEPGAGSTFALVVPLKKSDSELNAGSEEDGADLINPLKTIMERVGGDYKLAYTLLSGFGGEMAVLVTGIESDIAEGNEKGALEKSRALKNISAPMGAVEIGKTAERLEMALRESKQGEIGDIMELLKKLSTKTSRALRAQGVNPCAYS